MRQGRRDLEREERVPAVSRWILSSSARANVAARRVLEQLVQRAHAQGTDADELAATVRERPVETQRHGAARAEREQKADAVTREPACRELEHARRGRIEPLHVVDRDDDGRALGEQHEQRDDRRRHRARARDVATAPRARVATSSASRCGPGSAARSSGSTSASRSARHE